MDGNVGVTLLCVVRQLPPEFRNGGARRNPEAADAWTSAEVRRLNDATSAIRAEGLIGKFSARGRFQLVVDADPARLDLAVRILTAMPDFSVVAELDTPLAIELLRDGAGL